jgi:HlyD family secretion protein
MTIALPQPGRAPPLPTEVLVGGIDDDPRPDLRASLIILGVFTLLIVAWANLAPLDAAATAVGRISVSGHNQIVEHREGGVVAAVDVTEGQHVRAGQVLVELVPEDVGAQVRSLSAQVISLQAQHARLTAEMDNTPRIAWPAGFDNLTGEDLNAAKAAMRIQQAQFDADQGAFRAQESIGASKAQGLGEQVVGGQGQLASNLRQQALLDEQLKGVHSLAERGYASQNAVRALERSAAELAGAHDQLQANVADYREQIVESQFSLRSLRQQRAEATATALRDTEDQLSAGTPKLEAARLQLARGTLRAASDGVVTGLTVFGPGVVAAPGQPLMQIVPSHPSLRVEARIAANDIQGVKLGQRGEVRLSSLGARGTPLLSGVLTRLSADSFTDEHTGQSYYTAEITVPKSQLDLLSQDVGSAVRPGLPVQVIIPLHKRTALDYLFEPLSQSLWKSFRQR